MSAAPAHGTRGPSLVLFAIMTAHALLETGRDALFLGELGPGRLAWAYIAIAALSIGAVVLTRRTRAGGDPRRLLLGGLVIAAVGTAAFAARLAHAAAGVFALYLWTGMVAAVVLPGFWLVVDRSNDVGAARRRFVGISAAGGLGALTGFVLAAVLGALGDARTVILAAAAAYALAALLAARHLVVVVDRPARVRAARADRSAAATRSSRYVRWLLVLGLAATLAVTLGDLAFKRMVAAHLPADHLPLAFGATYAALNILGLLVQLSVTTRTLDRLGVGGALAILPLLVLASSLGLVATSALAAIVAFKLVDGGLRHGLYRVSSEILFLPLATSTREAARHAVEVVGQRGGQALAAALALVLVGEATSPWRMGVLVAIATMLWLVAIAMTRRGYMRQLRDQLEAGELQRTGEIPRLDVDSVAVIESSLASPDEREALAALDVLAAAGRPVPPLVLYHPSSAVVRRALRSLHGPVGENLLRVLAHLTGHVDPEIRAAALAASNRTGCNHEHLVAALDDLHPDVRAAANVALARKACGAATLALRGLSQLLDGSTSDRVSLARAVRRSPDLHDRNLLLTLVAHREPEVLHEVLQIWEELPELAELEVLLELLGSPATRARARAVFVAGGERFLAGLVAALDHPDTSLAVRRHLPRTISRFQSPRAASALVARLLGEADGTTEFKILRALGRMRTDNPALELDPRPLLAYTTRSIEHARRYQRWLSEHRALAGRATSTATLLADLLAEKHAHAIERAFRALGIIHPTADLRSVHDALVGDDDQRRATAAELLEDLVPAELHRPLLALMAQRGTPAPLPPDAATLFAAMRRDPSELLRSVAALRLVEAEAHHA